MPENLPLHGIRVVELAGLAPGPFCGLLLADYGATVLRIDGPKSPKGDVLARNKRSIQLNLKNNDSRALLLSIISKTDVLIDPFRPGVLERLGLSPKEVLLKLNPCLIVARLTGFRRDGRYKDLAGHDINYLAVSGVLSMLGNKNQPPLPPGNILGDFAGGGMMCFLGILLAWISRQSTGRGQIVEANMVDGVSYLATFPRLTTKTHFWNAPRGENMLDGGCPWYTTYATKDADKFFAVGALEPQFYANLVEGLELRLEDLPPRDDKSNWDVLRNIFAVKFREKTRAEWEAVFDNLDACATPVLEQRELEQDGFTQHLPVKLGDSASKIDHENGGWSGGRIEHGFRGQETLAEWFGWKKGVHYTEVEGVMVELNKAKI